MSDSRIMPRHELDRAARVMRALAHPIRLGILQQLATGELNVSALTERLSCSQPMMSQQLQVLERQSLIASRREGTIKYCALKNADFLNMMTCLHKHLELYMKGRD